MTAKLISDLTDAELILAVYGEVSRSPYDITRLLHPDQRAILRYRLLLQQHALSAEALGYDVRRPPFNVPCPVCHAFAGSACLSERRERDPRDILKFLPMRETVRVVEMHAEREKHWAEHPEFRVEFT